MSAYTLTSDIASITKIRKDTLIITSHNQYAGTELNDEKLEKLYSMYCSLLLMQYAEDFEKEQNNDRD